MPLPYEKTSLGLEIPAFYGGEEDARVLARNLKRIDNLLSSQSGGDTTILDLGNGITALASGNVNNRRRVWPLQFTHAALQACHDYLFAQGGGTVALFPGQTYTISQAGGLVPHIRAWGAGFTSAPTLTVSDPDWSVPGARRAAFTAFLGSGADAGRINYVRVDDPGWGYLAPATVTSSGGGGSGLVVSAHVVGLSWKLSDVGLEGNDAVLVDTGTSGYAMRVGGRTVAVAGSWDSAGPRVFGGFSLRGPGYNNGDVHSAQTNKRDGMLIGQAIGGLTAAAGSAAGTVMERITINGFRNNRVFADTSYLNQFDNCTSSSFWQNGELILGGADAGENYSFVGGKWANGKYTAGGINKILIVLAGTANYTNPVAVIPPPPSGGVQATATVYMNRQNRCWYVEMDDHGSGYDKNMVYQAGWPPGLIPITINDSGGSGAGAVAVGFTSASAFCMPVGGNADVRLTNPSIDYCDMAAVMMGGSLTGCTHTEGDAVFPFYYVAQGTNPGSEHTTLYLQGGDISPTRAAERDCLIYVDNINGGDKVSVIAPTRFNTYDFKTEHVRVANESGVIKKLDLRGADFNCAGGNFAVPSRYLNQLINGKFNSTAGWDFSGATGATFTANAGTGRSGNSGRLVCNAVNANGGTSAPRYVLRQFVPCRPGETVFSEFYYRVIGRTAGYFTLSVIYTDANFNALAGGRVLVNSTAGAVADVDWTRVGGGNAAAVPGTRYAGVVIDMSTYTATLDLDDMYLFVQ